MGDRGRALFFQKNHLGALHYVLRIQVLNIISAGEVPQGHWDAALRGGGARVVRGRPDLKSLLAKREAARQTPFQARHTDVLGVWSTAVQI